MIKLSHVLACGFLLLPVSALIGCSIEDADLVTPSSDESKTIVIETESLTDGDRIAINLTQNDAYYQINVESINDMKLVDVITENGTFSLADYAVWEDGSPVGRASLSKNQTKHSAKGTGTADAQKKCICIEVCCRGGMSCWCEP